jgi:hypothetical protein
MPALLLRWLAPYLMKGIAIAGALVGLWLYILHVEHAAKASQKAADAAVVREATLQANINALTAARAQEAAFAQGTKEANDKLLPELADSRSRLAVYLARLRGEASRGGTVATGLPATADAASLVDRADRDAVLASDLDRCTVAVTRLANAQAWAVKELTP